MDSTGRTDGLGTCLGREERRTLSAGRRQSACSIHYLVRPVLPLQLLDCLDDRPPDGGTLGVQIGVAHWQVCQRVGHRPESRCSVQRLPCDPAVVRAYSQGPPTWPTYEGIPCSLSGLAAAAGLTRIEATWATHRYCGPTSYIHCHHQAYLGAWCSRVAMATAGADRITWEDLHRRSGVAARRPAKLRPYANLLGAISHPAPLGGSPHFPPRCFPNT